MAEIAKAMRIFYIHQYFRMPEEGGAVRSYHLAKGLAEAGIQVEVITGGNIKSYDQRWIDGVKVHYLPVEYDQKFGFLKRVWAFLAFVRKAKNLIPKLGRADLLYVTSTPLTTGLIGLWAKKGSQYLIFLRLGIFGRKRRFKWGLFGTHC